MTLAERARPTHARILTVDIETMPGKSWTWEAKVHGGYLNPAMLIEPSRVGCLAWKWLDRKPVTFHAEWDAGGRDEMVKASWQAYDAADIVVTYNGKKFDNRHLRREWLAAGLPPPRPWKDVDLIQTARSQFAFWSNRLATVSDTLGIGSKVAHEGFPLWVACMRGDPKARARMKRYNVGDVRLTEALYVELLPWLKSHPHVTIADAGELTCNRCGSRDLDKVGTYRAVVLAYDLYRCASCAGLVRSTSSKARRTANTFGV